MDSCKNVDSGQVTMREAQPVNVCMLSILYNFVGKTGMMLSALTMQSTRVRHGEPKGQRGRKVWCSHNVPCSFLSQILCPSLPQNMMSA